ncbi:486_t:CDS:1, partial [Cetraspora pellucida]
SNLIAAKAHKHLAKVAITKVLYINTQEHFDGNYCLASVIYIKQFASMFTDISVIIFQNNKKK